jgi:DNA-binding NtrC family response regulator
MLEAELFGHEAGAFTGATSRRMGVIEKASRGVLFLDEIGDLPCPVQLKLLRFLESKTFSRVGNSEEIAVDLQIVAATNADLSRRVAEGLMRDDFYFRLRKVEIHMPALRDRAEDIPLLADHFLDLFRRQNRTKVEGLSDEARSALVRYDWPGNVRELKSALERAVIYSNRHGYSRVMLDDLPREVLAYSSVPTRLGTAANVGDLDGHLDEALARAELAHIEKALKAAGGRKDEAWKLLGLNDRFALRRRVGVVLRRHPQVAQQFPLVWRLYSRKEA